MTLIFLFAAMAVLSLVEILVPFRAPLRGARLGTNALLTASALALYLAIGAGVFLLPDRAPSVAEIVVAIVALDCTTYVVHRLAHALPFFWRFHRVHHLDPLVDVTTTLRQHPVETIVRGTATLGVAAALGLPPLAYAIYRVASLANALLEHANVRTPARLDAAISYVAISPRMHKIHHHRRAPLTDTNFGNLLSIFDRLGGTFTPTARAEDVEYGLDALSSSPCELSSSRSA